MSRRDQIEMTDEEISSFLDSQRVVICATNGQRGWPHLMPLWYVVRDEQLWAWTYAKSQKVRNLERDPRVTLQVEAGEAYEALRGVMIEAEVTIHRDLERVAALGAELMRRYVPGLDDDGVRSAVEGQAAKRVGLQFAPRRTASWDHRKLGGTY